MCSSIVCEEELLSQDLLELIEINGFQLIVSPLQFRLRHLVLIVAQLQQTFD
jgi:hypothetical protein